MLDLGFVPVFEHGLILKKHMLEALRDYPIQYVNTIFSEMANGVIVGLDVELTEDESFVVGAGIVKIGGKVFILDNSEKIDFFEQKNYVYLNIVQDNQVDGIYYKCEIVQKNIEDNSLFELFRYVKNAEVKKYSSVYDLFSDTTNRIDQRKLLSSKVGGSTLINDYFVLYGKELLKKENLGVKDCIFAYQCLNRINDIEIVKEYFQLEEVDNEAVIMAMKNKLEEIMHKTDNNISNEQKIKPKTTQIHVY